MCVRVCVWCLWHVRYTAWCVCCVSGDLQCSLKQWVSNTDLLLVSDFHLPVKLSTKETVQYPQFVSLLQQLGQLLTPDALSVDTQKDLKQVHSGFQGL